MKIEIIILGFLAFLIFIYLADIKIFEIITGLTEKTYNFSDWQLLGDPNNCQKDTICPIQWCDLRNTSCKVNSMFINVSNETLLGEKTIILGHYSKDSYTYLHSKLDLRRDINVLDKESFLSLYTKVKTENIRSNTFKCPWEGKECKMYVYFIIISHSGKEDVLWRLSDITSAANTYKEWQLLNFSLSGYAGKNVTLIFRFMQDFCCGNDQQWDVSSSGTSLWNIGSIKITNKRSITTTKTENISLSV